MPYLFVGGALDGQHKDVEPYPCVKVPIANRDGDGRVTVSYHYYFPHRFSAKSTTQEWRVYAIEGMTTDQIFERLLACYQPAEVADSL